MFLPYEFVEGSAAAFVSGFLCIDNLFVKGIESQINVNMLLRVSALLFTFSRCIYYFTVAFTFSTNLFKNFL